MVVVTQGINIKGRQLKDEILGNIAFRLRTKAQEDQREKTAEQKVDNQQTVTQVAKFQEYFL